MDGVVARLYAGRGAAETGNVKRGLRRLEPARPPRYPSPVESEYEVVNRVREIRKRLGMRQEDLATQVGVSRQTIIALERGRLLNPSIFTCLNLARVLGEPVGYLFCLSPKQVQGEKEQEDASGDVAREVRTDEDAGLRPSLPPEEEPAAVEPEEPPEAVFEMARKQAEPPEVLGPQEEPAAEPRDPERRAPEERKESPPVQGVWDFD